MTFQPTHRVTAAPPGATGHNFPLGTRVMHRPDLKVYPGPGGGQAHAYTDEDDHCQWLLDSDVGPLSSRSLEERIRLRILTEGRNLDGEYLDVEVNRAARIAAFEAEDSR